MSYKKHTFVYYCEKKEANKAFQPLMNQMKAAQKFIFIVPEYNGSFPGILKLFIDALEFPETLKNKKCALVGLSAGVQGSVLAMSHLTDIFNYLTMHVLAQKIKLMGISNRMSDDGITDEMGIQLLEEQAARHS
ncbi:MAG: NAD(P)H-dependent oxidoreductase [Ekhidna sp.]|nr:NAD(P)H-dependent oxidoreductase [Ekhidna sp.]